MTLSFEAVDPQHPEALRLLADAASEVRAMYPALTTPDAPPPGNDPAVARSTYLLAREGSQSVGCGALRPIEPDVAEVRRMYVSPSHRRQGVARALLAQLEKRAVKLGYEVLRLETGNRQTGAMALYEACGFKRIPAFGPYANDPTSVCFEKWMTPPP
jgi:GNAT superfamily N-acetyltransferase